jgi:hypothetical protein
MYVPSLITIVNGTNGLADSIFFNSACIFFVPRQMGCSLHYRFECVELLVSRQTTNTQVGQAFLPDIEESDIEESDIEESDIEESDKNA